MHFLTLIFPSKHPEIKCGLLNTVFVRNEFQTIMWFHTVFFFFFSFQATLLQLGIFVVVKYMHHRDDLVEHRTREASFGAQYTNHSVYSWCSG